MSKANTKLKWGGIAAIVIALVAAITGAAININIENGKVNADIVYSDETIVPEMEGDQGEIIKVEEIDGEEIKTVEEIDGGKFEDATTGVSVTEGEYEDLGWSEIYNVSSPEAFKNDTLGKCIIANNRYGAQCVSLARVFWWSYADRDVSTCGTGAAKGMMNCADQNAGNDFLVYWADNKDKIQAGDWLVFDGGQYGHVGMALGPVVNGYVALLGENQGGHSCGQGVGGSATNIININIKNLIGFYRPKAYVKPEPKPAPAPTPTPAPTPAPAPVSNVVEYVVKKGDTLGAILRAQGYKGKKLFGDNGLAQKVADDNGIKNRGLIFPKQIIVINKAAFNKF